MRFAGPCSVWVWVARRQHLRQGDAAQGIDHHVVDAAPVGAHAAGLLDAAVAGVDAALGHAERAFQRLDDLDQADRLGGAGQPVAAGGAAEGRDQPGLGQWLEYLGHGRRLQTRAFGQFRRAQDGLGVSWAARTVMTTVA